MKGTTQDVIRVGIDVGGTFTDLVLERLDGSRVSHKRLTTPQDPVEGFVLGLVDLLGEASVNPDEVAEVLHATTLGSNVVIERRGARIGMITTSGFRDILEIQRALRHSMYDIDIEKPTPLVPRSRIWEVTERAMADGSIVTPLDEAGIRAIVRDMKAEGIVSVAVAFLHSYANPKNERRTRELILEETPEMQVSLSSDVSMQAREYERFSTTVVNAYLTPIFRDYLSRLESRLNKNGLTPSIWIMQSSGGLTSRDYAGETPARSIESGPAAGVLMAAYHGSVAGHDNTISFDMGGTTAKISIISDGRPSISKSFELDRKEMRDGSGLPIDSMAIDLIEIGSGGGSIAQANAGVLQVGPRSASSEPGPVCYARGGSEATVTDAALALGYLNPDYFAGGAMTLDLDGAQRALASLGETLGMDMIRTAWGIHELVVLNMERATRLVSIEKGLDPRDYALICFGGAGPVHGARLARSLGARRMIVPINAGIGSALGLLEAEETVDFAQTKLLSMNDGDATSKFHGVFESLMDESLSMIADRWSEESRCIQRSVGMRYVGQGYELELDLADEASIDLGQLARTFNERYEALYGYAENLEVEIATWRLSISRRKNSKVAPLPQLADRGGADSSPKTFRSAYFGERGWIEVPVYDRFNMVVNKEVLGPCMIEERDTTTVVPADMTCFVDEFGNLIIEIEGEGRERWTV